MTYRWAFWQPGTDEIAAQQKGLHVVGQMGRNANIRHHKRAGNRNTRELIVTPLAIGEGQRNIGGHRVRIHRSCVAIEATCAIHRHEQDARTGRFGGAHLRQQSG